MYYKPYFKKKNLQVKGIYIFYSYITSMSRISLLLQETRTRSSVNNNNILQVLWLQFPANTSHKSLSTELLAPRIYSNSLWAWNWSQCQWDIFYTFCACLGLYFMLLGLTATLQLSLNSQLSLNYVANWCSVKLCRHCNVNVMCYFNVTKHILPMKL